MNGTKFETYTPDGILIALISSRKERYHLFAAQTSEAVEGSYGHADPQLMVTGVGRES
ncbi:hypothetical protein KKH18_05075 [bacterium]|nr:hypothetical protein [bacterium]